MEKLLKLNDTINATDAINDRPMKENRTTLRTEIMRVNEFGEVMWKRSNKVIIPGAAFIARKLFDVERNEITPSYNEVLQLDNSVNEVPSPLDIEKCFLFSVGTDGGGTEGSQIYPVNYGKWCAPENLVPFRFQPENQDLDPSLRDSYFGRKTYTGTKRIAYYFKSFDTEPRLIQQWVDGTPITHEIYESSKIDELETYIEFRLKITKEDCRDWFISTTGINTAKLNTLSLLTCWSKVIDGVTYYQDIRPLTKLNFPQEWLIDLTKSIDLIYHVYF